MALLLLIPLLLIFLLWTVSTYAAAPAWLREATRAVLLAVLGLCVAGFGLCGAVGTFFGLTFVVQSSDVYGPAFLVPGLMGLVLAFGAYKLRTKVRSKPSDRKDQAE
jgi:hypothetical protein